MVAVDTNIIVRLVTGDDESQAAMAKAVFGASEIWISKTVLLEMDWVLRSAYGYSDSAIRAAILGLLGLDGVRAEDESAVADALALVEKGISFADALHVSSRPSGTDFITFDQVLVRRALRAGTTGIKFPAPAPGRRRPHRRA